MTDRNLGQELRGVILLSDGIDRAGLQNLFTTNSSISNLPQLPGPLTIIEVGSGEKIFDESIVSVQSGGFAFQRTPFQLKAAVVGRPKSAITVQLRKNNKVVQDKTVRLDDEGKGEVVFDIRHWRLVDLPGKFKSQLILQMLCQVIIIFRLWLKLCEKKFVFFRFRVLLLMTRNS